MAQLFDLRDLECFVAAAEARNFTRAAARMCVSQPAFSQRMAALERRIGTRLFERAAQGVGLTPAGLALLDGARTVLSSAETVAAASRAGRREGSERLRLGYVEYAARRWIAPIVSAVLRRHPGARIEPQPMPAFEMAGALQDHHIDLGIGIRPISGAGIATRTLVAGSWQAVLAGDHPLAKVDVVPLAALRDQPLVLFARSLNEIVFDRLIDVFRRAGFVPNVAFQAADSGLGVELAAQNVGILLIASYALPPIPAGAVVRPVKGIPGRPTLALVWRRSDSNHTIATAMRAAIAVCPEDI